jgi:hypothetical protein
MRSTGFRKKKGAPFKGDKQSNQAYFSYGKSVLAVADATVLTARDALLDNARVYQNEQIHPAAPITMETLPVTP